MSKPVEIIRGRSDDSHVCLFCDVGIRKGQQCVKVVEYDGLLISYYHEDCFDFYQNAFGPDCPPDSYTFREQVIEKYGYDNWAKAYAYIRSNDFSTKSLLEVLNRPIGRGTP